MAQRYAYLYSKKENKIEKRIFEFKWVAGGTLKSNRNCIKELHRVIEEEGFGKALDVSVNTEGKLARSLIKNVILNNIEFRKNPTIVPVVFDHYSLIEQYLVISELSKNNELSDFVLQFDAFTNISAKIDDEDKSAANVYCLYKYLVNNSLLEEYLTNPDKINVSFD